MSNVFVGSDHAGFAFKTALLAQLKESFPQFKWEDLGCHSEDRCDYPNYAKAVGEKVGAGEGKGLLICGSGLGVMIAANKV